MANVFMNGLTAHAFAALMVALVTVFPEPEDLQNAIFDPGPTDAQVVASGVTASFPEVAEDIAPDRLIDALTSCANDQSGTLPLYGSECQSIIDSTADVIPMLDDAQTAFRVEEKMELAKALYCRRLWAEANARRAPFDLSECQSAPLALAGSL